MKTRMKVTATTLLVFLVAVSLVECSRSGAVGTEVDCSRSSVVQAALNSASSGDTVKCSASGGVYSWGTIIIPGDRNITLDGNGAKLIGGHIRIRNSTSYYSRVTNFTFNASTIVSTGTGSNNKPWRIDHCTIDGSEIKTSPILSFSSGPGLIDHCTWTNINSNLESTWNIGWGQKNYAGWYDSVTPGSAAAIYVEDSTMTGQRGDLSSLMHGMNGARIVFRHNTMNSIMLDAHGNYSNPPSTRWWEIYDNTMNNGSTFCLRGGSGLVFNNNGSGLIIIVDEDYNASNDNGIGKGQLVPASSSGTNDYFPAYLWSNGTVSTLYNQDGCAQHYGTVSIGHDVITASSGTTLPDTCSSSPDAEGFWMTDTSTLYKCTAPNSWTAYYTPYPYPHPLQNGRETNSHGED